MNKSSEKLVKKNGRVISTTANIPTKDLTDKTSIHVGMWLLLLVTWYCWAYYTSMPLVKEAFLFVSTVSIWSISKTLNVLSTE